MHSSPLAPAPRPLPTRPLFRAAPPRSIALAAALALATSARAQDPCAEWDAGFGAAAGLSPLATVTALAVYDDGSGAALYAAGDLGQPGGTGAGGIARWNGSAWLGVGSAELGIPGTFRALSVYDLGAGPELFAGGSWSHIACTYPTVGRWGPSGWSLVGLPCVVGSGPTIEALAGYDDGSGPALYAAGTFSTPAYARIARWDGSAWSAVGLSGGADAPVRALCVYDDGSGPALYVGGEFTTVGGVASPHLARWDGTWSAVGAPLAGTDGDVWALAVHDDGTGPALYVGGSFQTAGGVASPHVARWKGGAWSAAGSSPPDGAVLALASFPAGDGARLVAGGTFSAVGSTAAVRVAVLDGAGWAPLGEAGNGADSAVLALASWDDGDDGSADLYLGGAFTSAGPWPSYKVAEWHGCLSEAYCFGDGSGAACPCANAGAAGRGCENSASTGGARLDRSGTTVGDTLVLTQTGELASSLSIFLQGGAEIAPVAFGDGLRCAGGSLLRLYVANAVAGVVSAPGPGDPSIRARAAALGDLVQPGSARHYQVYYRDPSDGFCPNPPGGAFNVGNALRVVW